MIFGKIEYLNLLPFHVFMKRYAKSTRHHLTLEYKKGVPSKINRDFRARRVDAAFISSIAARRAKHRAGLGIVARGEVLSVLVLPSQPDLPDGASATSNLLTKVLGLHGTVLIGDRALRYRLAHTDATDLALEWQRRFGLPFVFALLCYHTHAEQMRKLERAFLRRPINIPGYLLSQAARRSGVCESDIRLYLKHISYRIDRKCEKSVRKFWSMAAQVSPAKGR